MILDDSAMKTIKIPVVVMKGELKCFFGGDLPKFKEGIIGDLVLPEFAVTDKKFIKRLKYERTVEILPEETKLLVAIKASRDSNLTIIQKYTLKTDSQKYDNYDFVEIIIVEPLELLMRGSKKATLKDTNCIIPSISLAVQSLNAAYTRISEMCEGNRRSHTGNVFEKIHYFSEHDEIWYPLEVKRNIEEAQYEKSQILDNREFILNEDYGRDIELNNDEKKIISCFQGGKIVKGQYLKELVDEGEIRHVHAIYKLLVKGILEFANI